MTFPRRKKEKKLGSSLTGHCIGPGLQFTTRSYSFEYFEYNKGKAVTKKNWLARYAQKPVRWHLKGHLRGACAYVRRK